MQTKDLPTRREAAWALLALLLLLAVTVAQLHHQGRLWWCACGSPFLWVGDIWSAHTSQHLFDPYSFTHVLHGVLLCGILAFALPRMQFVWQLLIAVGLESLWEIVENSRFVINRYRTVTMGLGYEGDSIANSLSDILCCVLGFMIARHLGLRRSVIFFVATELVLLAWIRDNLTLNILMLTWPIDAIKTWQMVH
jgi:hypothetical protein